MLQKRNSVERVTLGCEILEDFCNVFAEMQSLSRIKVTLLRVMIMVVCGQNFTGSGQQKDAI